MSPARDTSSSTLYSGIVSILPSGILNQSWIYICNKIYLSTFVTCEEYLGLNRANMDLSTNH